MIEEEQEAPELPDQELEMNNKKIKPLPNKNDILHHLTNKFYILKLIFLNFKRKFKQIIHFLLSI